MAVVVTVLALVPVDRLTAHIWADQQHREVNAGVPEARSGPHGCLHPHIIQSVLY